MKKFIDPNLETSAIENQNLESNLLISNQIIRLQLLVQNEAKTLDEITNEINRWKRAHPIKHFLHVKRIKNSAEWKYLDQRFTCTSSNLI